MYNSDKVKETQEHLANQTKEKFKKSKRVRGERK